MHREQYGEYAYWCQVVFRTWFSFTRLCFRKASSVKKEESSKAKKSRRAISLDSGKEIMSTYWGYVILFMWKVMWRLYLHGNCDFIYDHVTKSMGTSSNQLRNSFGRNNTMGCLKGTSPLTSKILKSILFTVCHTSVMKISLRIWCSIKWYPVVWWFSFFSSHCCSVDCELVLLREIRKLITLKSANFKLDPEL